VESLRDREELGVAGDHDPVHLDPEPARVPEQRSEHLGDPATPRGRVDVDDVPAANHLPALGSGQ